MKKHIILLLVLLCHMLGIAAADKVYISDFSIKAGETKRIALCFDTDRTDVTRLSGTVIMPVGLSVVNQSSNAGIYTWITGNNTRTGGAMVSYNTATGSVLMTSGAFTAGTGAVGYIDVRASTSLAETSTITIKDFKVKKSDGTFVNVASENCTVTLETGEQGGDQSGEVSFSFSNESITLDNGQTTTVDVTMTNSTALTGLQATLTASEGITITGVTKSNRIVGQFRYNTTSGLIMCFGSFEGNEGTMFTVGLKVDDDFAGSSATLTISDLAVTTANAQSITASDITLNVTVPVLELTLNEEQENSQTLTENDGERANVTLTRTLKTGGYNTFSVPFDIPAEKFNDYKLSGVKKLTASSFDSSTGVLALTFDNESECIEAGKPYLVKVSENVVNPIFNGVTVSSAVTTTETDAVDFVPTFGATTLTGSVKSILFLSGNNTLYHPHEENSQLKGFRAYFRLKDEVAQQARAFSLDFGDGETTVIGDALRINDECKMTNEVFDLQGRRIQGKSTRKGVYIVNGKKTLVK